MMAVLEKMVVEHRKDQQLLAQVEDLSLTGGAAG
jgi:hypothetical protein